MRALFSTLIPLIMCGCHTLNSAKAPVVTKTIVVLPVADGSAETVDAIPEFLGAATYFSLRDAPGYAAPLNWITECGRDGTMRITWTTFRGAKEKLYLTEAGFHPVEVPLHQAIVIKQRDQFTPTIAPITLRMTGNTAGLPKRDRRSYRAGKLSGRTPEATAAHSEH
jgi:hypothetical protein